MILNKTTFFTAQLVTCSDKMNNCAAYGQGVCTSYGEWAHDNCQQFCGFCGKRYTFIYFYRGKLLFFLMNFISKIFSSACKCFFFQDQLQHLTDFVSLPWFWYLQSTGNENFAPSFKAVKIKKKKSNNRRNDLQKPIMKNLHLFKKCYLRRWKMLIQRKFLPDWRKLERWLRL